ncbi:MAG: triose-phosphate isomerase [Desulfobacterota bacterium]|nr:triose-phosphate isomerase [Thermodesulfobacteriota bacterium]MDW8002772.1 triose-phosphate isomerase [Deltaproteobacteria bacterium]
MKRKWIVAGNWKMHKTLEEARILAKDVVKRTRKINAGEIVLAPPFTALKEVNEVIEGSGVKLAAQNCHFEEKGAYTGEISPFMLKDVGCTYVILGHSERRKLFQETDEVINRKIKAALRAGLKPIVCVGETEEERDTGITEYVIGQQLKKALKGVELTEDIVIAYEPVWAIGTGKNATPQEAEEAHRFIRDLLIKIYGQDGETIRILYGGSVSPENVSQIVAMENVDGALVGGASLKSESFVAIIEEISRIKK